MLFKGWNITKLAAASGRSHRTISQYYFKIGKALEQRFPRCRLESDFKQIVTYLVGHYAPLSEEDEFEFASPRKENGSGKDNAPGKKNSDVVDAVEKVQRARTKNKTNATHKEFKVISPTGALLTGTDQMQFCRERNLDYNSFYLLLKGRFKQHKGYRGLL